MFRTSIALALLTVAAACGGGSGHASASNTAARPRAQTYGRGGLPAEATRTVEIRMGDNLRFDPATVAVKHGEIVTFHVVNTGKILHELTVGGADAQDLHEAQMAQMSMTGDTMAGGMDMGSMPGMEHGTMPNTPEHRRYMKNLAHRIASLDKSAAANASVHVPAGESRDMTWAFLGDQLPVFGCHVAQHWSGGMRGAFAWAS
ncbi:MAG TPA: hypothetical protein VKJ83_07735 [Actinomycetota bacterium]|nr:hypothetical protein [Actinomycetota bacterium]